MTSTAKKGKGNTIILNKLIEKSEKRKTKSITNHPSVDTTKPSEDALITNVIRFKKEEANCEKLTTQNFTQPESKDDQGKYINNKAKSRKVNTSPVKAKCGFFFRCFN
jgi:hypothetical protein